MALITDHWRRDCEWWNKPLAAPGLRSYRYRGRYGCIAIGAIDIEHALREAARSTQNIERKNLEAWDGSKFVPALPGM